MSSLDPRELRGLKLMGKGAKGAPLASSPQLALWLVVDGWVKALLFTKTKKRLNHF